MKNLFWRVHCLASAYFFVPGRRALRARAVAFASGNAALVTYNREKLRLHRHIMLPKGSIQAGFLIRAFFTLPDDEGTADLIISGRERLGVGARNND